MCGTIPRVCGPVTLSVHHGSEQWSGGRLARACAQGRSGEWELTASWGKGRGAPRGGGGSSPRVQKGGMVVVGEVAGGAGVFYRAGGEGTEAVGEVVGRVLG
jgi:hypothetical protein